MYFVNKHNFLKMKTGLAVLANYLPNVPIQICFLDSFLFVSQSCHCHITVMYRET